MFVAALESIHKDRESRMSQSCPVEALLERSTWVQTNEHKRQKIKNEAHSNSQYKLRQVLFAQVLCVIFIIDMWVAMGTIDVLKVYWC